MGNVLFNCLFAVLYEAFPEEVLIRGLILNELRKKFKFIPSLFIQPVLFVIIGGSVHIISNLIHLGNPELLSVVGLMIQFLYLASRYNYIENLQVPYGRICCFI